jgi:hypothetical protein
MFDRIKLHLTLYNRVITIYHLLVVQRVRHDLSGRNVKQKEQNVILMVSCTLSIVSTENVNYLF